MKKNLLFLLLVLTPLVSKAKDISDWNCYDWQELSQETKIGYALSFITGVDFVVEDVVKSCWFYKRCLQIKESKKAVNNSNKKNLEKICRLVRQKFFYKKRTTNCLYNDLGWYI